MALIFKDAVEERDLFLYAITAAYTSMDIVLRGYFSIPTNLFLALAQDCTGLCRVVQPKKV